MSLPDNWGEACRASEARMKDRTPIDPINAIFCLENDCPAAQCITLPTPYGLQTLLYCQFSKCIHRFPSKKEMKYLK